MTKFEKCLCLTTELLAVMLIVYIIVTLIREPIPYYL